MNYYTEHRYAEPLHLTPAATPERYAAVVGAAVVSTEHEIMGRDGEHCQFYVDIGNGVRYQVDVNIQSSDGQAIEMYVGAENVDPVGVTPDEPFGTPQYGVFPASLGYAGIGLADAMFAPVSAVRIAQQIEAALAQSTFVAVYGFTFDDGGPGGKGIHDTHLNVAHADQDGALAIYGKDASGQPQRKWFFFKFAEDHIASQQAR
ncbi:hypothetical protein [Trinickia acidisoli]|uniref:hypothetical protein n=1 Tax=Trinickia acidisoli TaxID=2767482 RepID=UPI001A8BF569|nr:hypothetical protein [Trinickia acidisoli]